MSEHVRRKRYNGKYPKNYDEKYKELHPELYPEEIEHVIAKGSTPAGMHIPIMVNEILDFLDIQKGQIGLDCTLGYGGHSLQMLKKLNDEGHLYGLDVDAIEQAKTTERLKNHGFDNHIFTPLHINFRYIDQVSQKYGPFDFVLADLGVSSMQIDNPERGFSFKKDGPLDLRLDSQKGAPASAVIKTLSRDELEHIFATNSDEPYAHEIAITMDSFLKSGYDIDTTRKLYKVIEKALKDVSDPHKKDLVNKTAARVFQALRIEVNSEFDALYDFAEKLPGILKPGGKAAILTFHSGEDRIIKKSFKEFKNLGVYADVNRRVIRPSAEECHRNPRAKSTKMRWAIKA